MDVATHRGRWEMIIRFLFWLCSHWLEVLEIKDGIWICRCAVLIYCIHCIYCIWDDWVSARSGVLVWSWPWREVRASKWAQKRYLQEDPTEDPGLVKSAARHKDLHLKASVRQRGVITCTGWIFISSERWSQRNEKGKQPSLAFTLQREFLRPSGWGGMSRGEYNGGNKGRASRHFAKEWKIG